MDDTLYDELDYYQSGLAAVARQIADDFKLDNKAVFEALWGIFNSGNHKTAFNATLEKFSVSFDDEYIQKVVNVLRCHKPDITLPSESRDVLNGFKNHYKLGLITDGWLPAQELKVKALGIDAFFDCIIYTEKLGAEYWKPSPKGFEKLLTDHSVTASESIYVGDNLKKDFLSPNQMGFKTIRVIRPKRIHLAPAPSTDAVPNYEIDSIAKLPELLRKIDAV